jgi:hypothetical protein
LVGEERLRINDHAVPVLHPIVVIDRVRLLGIKRSIQGCLQVRRSGDKGPDSGERMPPVVDVGPSPMQLSESRRVEVPAKVPDTLTGED